MKRFAITMLFFVSLGFSKVKAQTAGEFNYSVALRGFSMMQLPKIYDEIDGSKFSNVYGNGVILKFNDNQISTRLSGNFISKNTEFNNRCSTCEIVQGKSTDYSVKIGFEKNMNYSLFQPYFGADIGFRSSAFDGKSTGVGTTSSVQPYELETSKNGLVLGPVFGFKVNVANRISLFAESSFDLFYSYERQDIVENNSGMRTLFRYTKWEFLLNPVSAGIQFQLVSKN